MCIHKINQFIRKIIKKILAVVGLYKYPVTVKSEKWILEQSLQYREELKRDTGIDAASNIEVKAAYPLQSMAIEKAVTTIINTKKHKFGSMLVIRNPYQYAPLCALAGFYTFRKRSVKVTVFGKEDSENITYTVKEDNYHHIPIMGLYPEQKNKIKIELLNKKNKVTRKRTFFITTGKLKGKSSGIQVVHQKKSPDDFLYHLTLVYGGDDGVFPYVFDRKGDIRFSFSMVPKTYGFRPVCGGRYLFLDKSVTRHTDTNPTSVHMYEVDQMGRFITKYNIAKGAHHDFCKLDNGNYAVISNSFDNNTIEDTVIEVEHETGAVVNEVWLKDYVDDCFVDSPDWAHINTLEYNNHEKTLMVCLRNLHAVIKLNYETKKLEWVLGNPDFFKGTSMEDKVLTPLGNIEWFFQAHTACFVDKECDEEGYRKLIIYDNHINKRRPVSYYTKSKNSYAVLYQINETKKTVSMVKRFATDKSNVRSNAIYEKAYNRVCVMNGKIKKEGSVGGSIIEFDYTTEEVLNKYTMNFGYYRAYPFAFCPNEMSQPMNINQNYSCGKLSGLEEVITPDIDAAQNIPPVILEDIYGSEKERSDKLKELVMEHPEQIDSMQDVARIELYIEEDTLYVKMIDHLLEGIYLVGQNYTYYKDLAQTSQKRPEYFARAFVGEALPLSGIEEDKYDIYYRFRGKLLRTDNWIDIKKVKREK